ncbi:pre-toxin TG domain-containing protein [Priestia filamentosa]|uniref:pre-toxin TG domain-containing protein n=1 Tax=Priestia filamentosa TaxID=1402861 RepID=UPI000A08DB40|nr:pre-toxin TG domain-containing protein [Priestia filamentosa]SMF69976.1 Pre-toxin TG [Priestia filamentosa]
MEEFSTIVDIKANFKDLEQLAQKTMQAKSKIDVIPGQLSYSLSGALSELSGVWTGELEALQQELESDMRKYSEGLGETIQHIQKTAQGLKEMDMVMNAILMPSNIVLHGLSKFGFDVTSKRFISYQGRITPATSQLMARYKKGGLYSYDILFPKPKKIKVKDNYEAEILEAVKNHKQPSPDALLWGMGVAQDKNIKDPMKRQFLDTKLTNGQVASFVGDFLPFYGNLKAADEARTGKQYFTEKKLDATDRAIATASVIGAGYTKVIGNGTKMILKGKLLSEQTHLKWNKKTSEVKQHTPKKTNGMGPAQTGGRELSIDEYLKQLDKADEMYESFRKSKTDVPAIAKNTGMTEERVQRIKDHLFIKEHVKEHGVGRFDPDYAIGQAWERLQKGTYKKNDIDLLNHELFESKFEGIFKTDYRTAHDKTVESGRPWYPPEEE